MTPILLTIILFTGGFCLLGVAALVSVKRSPVLPDDEPTPPGEGR